MKLSGTYEFRASAEEVYDRLLDPERLRSCMPGCERLDQREADRYALTLSVPIPAITGTYEGTVEIHDKQPPSSFRMRIEATGKSGFINAEAHMQVTPKGEGATVAYTADVQVGGAAASAGQRVLTGISRRQVQQMMRCLDAERPGRWARIVAWFRRRFGGE